MQNGRYPAASQGVGVLPSPGKQSHRFCRGEAKSRIETSLDTTYCRDCQLALTSNFFV